MKNIELLEKDAHVENKRKPFLTSITAKSGKQIKRVIYLSSLIGIGLLFNSCSLGYVATEPAYVEVSRPARPSNLHIWIDGDWVFSRQTQNYERRPGYWEQPRQNRTYIAGYWQAGPRGKNWVPGHWQRNGNNNRNHSNRGNR